MKCPFRIPMYCSRLGNSESSEAGRVQSGSFFFFFSRRYQMRLSLTRARVYMAHAWHTLHSVCWGCCCWFFFFNEGKIFHQQRAEWGGRRWLLHTSPSLHSAGLGSNHKLGIRHRRHVIKDWDHWEMASHFYTTGTRKKQVVGETKRSPFFFFLLKLAEPLQTWQRQVMCLADQFCRFSHSGICRFYASSTLHIPLPRWCPSSSHLSPQPTQMDWHISDVGPLLQMHPSWLSWGNFKVYSASMS